MASEGVIQLSSDYELVYKEDENLQKQKNAFVLYDEGVLRLSPGKYIVPKRFLSVAKSLYNFKLQPTDVVVMSYPKCGSTWMQEIIWTMINNPNLDHPLADIDPFCRCPYIEMDGFINLRKYLHDPKDFINVLPDFVDESKSFLELIEAMKPSRVMKTHLTPSMLDSSLLTTAKVVCTIRNPKDVLLSFFHMAKLFPSYNFKGTLEEFGEMFIGDGILYAPYAEHVREVLKLGKGHTKLAIFFYEDLKNDTYGEMQRLQAFLDIKLTNEQIHNIIHYTHIDQMKEREESKRKTAAFSFNEEVMKDGGGFYRSDENKNKSYKLSEEFELKFKEWAEANLSDLDIPYKF